MRRIVMVVVCLAGLACAQASYTGRANWSGVGIWGAGFQQGSGDLPLPDFTWQGGVPLSLPQEWVDPMEPFSQTIDNTVYIGNTGNGCPTAPSRTNYKGQSKGAGVCDYADSDGTGLATVANDWAALSGGSYDQRWQVVVTHGSIFTIPCNIGGSGYCWAWPTKYNATNGHATKYLVYGSDCTAASPCAGTNDLGYNPPGRQVCSHGINDTVTPAIPSMGQRNHGCQGYLGFPPVTAGIPVTATSYTHDAGYNDLANMWTIQSNQSFNLIASGPASRAGGPTACDNTDPTQPGTDACPVEGVNHIWLTDVQMTSSMPNRNGSNVNQFGLVNFAADEWSRSDMTSGWAGAGANHIGLSQFYLNGTTDDDGFGVPSIVNGLKLSCSYCAVTHGYMEGVKVDGGESHVLSLNDVLTGVMVADMWIEGGAIGLWGGGGGNPSIRGTVPGDIQVTRTRVTYNKRWLPPPAGNHPIKKTVLATGGSCSGTSMSLSINNAPPNSGPRTNITALGVYLKTIKTSGGTTVVANGWYALDNAPPQTSPATITISSTNNPGFSCSGTPASGSAYGFADNWGGTPTVDVAAMNAKGVYGQGDYNDAGAKDRIEAKSWERVLIDGLIDENGGAEAQEGQLMGNTVRAYSNCSYDNGNETARIMDLTVTNFIARNATEGLLGASRSGTGNWTDHPLTNITCNGTTQAVITAGDTMNNAVYPPPSFLPDLRFNCSSGGHQPCTNPSIGTDIYLTGIGGGLIPDGWYTTAYPTNGSYDNDTTMTVLADPNGVGTVCTVNNGTATSGTAYVVTQGSGHGVSWPSRRRVFQNGLLYGLGDPNQSNGSGTASIMQVGGTGNNFAVQVTVNADSTTATATSLAIADCPGGKQCPRVFQAAAGDLAWILCPDSRYNGVDSINPVKGTPILSVGNDQLSFTYKLNALNHEQLVPGNSITCPLPIPGSNTEAGYNNWQSYPWPYFVNHLTAVGVRGMDIVVGSGQIQYNAYATFTNSFQLVPGPNDVAPNDTCNGGTNPNCRYGMISNNGEAYDSVNDDTGITGGNDRCTLTFKSWAASTRNINNYPMFPAGEIGSGCSNSGTAGVLTGGNPTAYPGTNSTPTNVATAGAAVTCNSGQTCNATNYIPDSVGFLGSMGTSNFPFALADWRQYGLHSSSPYKAGGMLDATDGLDNGVQISLITNALARTQYVCPLDTSGHTMCNSAPNHDGPPYGFLSWSAYAGAVNYRVYRDSALIVSTTNLWFNDYGLPTGGHTWTVKAWDGTVEHAVSGLVSQIY